MIVDINKIKSERLFMECKHSLERIIAGEDGKFLMEETSDIKNCKFLNKTISIVIHSELENYFEIDVKIELKNQADMVFGYYRYIVDYNENFVDEILKTWSVA